MVNLNTPEQSGASVAETEAAVLHLPLDFGRIVSLPEKVSLPIAVRNRAEWTTAEKTLSPPADNELGAILANAKLRLFGGRTCC